MKIKTKLNFYIPLLVVTIIMILKLVLSVIDYNKSTTFMDVRSIIISANLIILIILVFYLYLGTFKENLGADRYTKPMLKIFNITMWILVVITVLVSVYFVKIAEDIKEDRTLLVLMLGTILISMILAILNYALVKPNKKE
ncbi:MAG: hypothetical protein RBQ97_01085 [Acholeplasma sp.]|nr:hypothetical protein [Acholeplasma sp.]